jgi:repeat uncharacterized protein DUF346
VFEWALGSTGATSVWSPISPAGAARANVAVVHVAPDRFDAFIMSEAGAVQQRTFSAGQWGSWHAIGGAFDLGISVASWSGVRIDAFAVDGGHVMHDWSDSDRWVTADFWGTEVTGAVSSSTCGVISLRNGSLDLFARNASGRLVHYWYDYDAFTWSDSWADTSLDVPGDPVAVLAGHQVHLFARNDDGSLWHVIWPR